MSHSSEFVINWTVTNTDPSVVVTQIRNRDTSQMRTHSRTYQNAAFSSWSQNNFCAFVQDSIERIFVLLLDFFMSKSSDKYRGSVPYDLNDFCWWKFRNINFHVGIPVISRPSVQPSNGSNCIESCKIQHTGVVNST